MQDGGNQLRRLFGSLPSVVSVVSAVGSDGVARGMTCNAVSAVSLSPPLLLVCLDHRSRTLTAVRERGAFVVNFLAAGRGEISRRFATGGDDKFAGLTVHASGPTGDAPVLVEDSAASAECRVHDVLDGGDHQIILGRALRCQVYDRPPLTYFGRRYDAWPVPAVPGAGR
ncbi:flavin reductase family protein [Micromonospora zhanjiangensis]|uniref:Flavin reductase family protein n=1 Tax=Micromonospora zhanjiangensis TaxID=1522057 RepID=A0ABV8KVG5_9ACTN